MGGELKENDTSTSNCRGRFGESFKFAFAIFERLKLKKQRDEHQVKAHRTLLFM